MDQYITLLLMCMFNPICVSLRSLQEASDLKKVRRVLNVPHASLGNLSEAARVFDSDLLVGIIGQLAEQLPPVRRDAELADFGQIFTLVDGSWPTALPKMTRALFGHDDTHRAVKAHVQFDLLKGVPTAAVNTDVNTSEQAVQPVVVGFHLTRATCARMSERPVAAGVRGPRRRSPPPSTAHWPFWACRSRRVRCSPERSAGEMPTGAWSLTRPPVAESSLRRAWAPGLRCGSAGRPPDESARDGDAASDIPLSA
ncbi:MAG: hypothetical protein ACOC95_03075 [Planctomycetota bacterium]